MSLRTVLAHGASGTAASMRPYVDGLRLRGIAAEAIDLPRRGRAVVAADQAVPVFSGALGTPPGTVVGGHSYGGRVASMLAAEQAVAGLVLLSYPLHRPGHPEALRTAHWPAIRCPVLLLSGEADTFARVDLLRSAVELLEDAELVTYPGVRHGLARHPAALEDALDRIAVFVAALPAALT